MLCTCRIGDTFNDLLQYIRKNVQNIEHMGALYNTLFLST